MRPLVRVSKLLSIDDKTCLVPASAMEKGKLYRTPFFCTLAIWVQQPLPHMSPSGARRIPPFLIRVLAFPPVADATELNSYVFAGKCLT
jgi:hypothetical protein